MKKLFLIIPVFAAALFCLASCRGRSIYAMEEEAKREAAFQSGYEAGYEEGYYAGKSETQEAIAFYVEDDLSKLEFDIKDETGMYPEEAIQILTNYADGHPVSESELNKALWTINYFYWDAFDIAHGIEDYWID